ncbi:o-succinylbenzoate--CoA ligase [Bacillus sp. 1NLA3E]|uniref:o-succinylbenzoate--CoA ligase n=1 Tax=Bacillus sp. 1NLA3E TaxID=666686 RepID=UPI000247F366|nr:o-succinylbenzoate--CoA ligase [Bacillus sp. 1NLA3E]AGK55311.1 O-succinylbenzoic acid--CoA ligase [Bacillus sp. 1NLA3E]
MTQQIPNWLKKRAFLTPSRTALIFEDQVLTFQDTYDRTLSISGKLAAVSIVKGQFIGVLLKNHLDTITILYALQMLGATAVILNNRLTEDELAWQLEDSKSVALITEDSFAPKIAALQAKKPLYSIWTKQQLFSINPIQPNLREEYELEGICTIMYTSGTTGFPKGVKQTYGNHWWSSIGSALNLGISEQDCWLCTVPLFHISGYSILVRSLVYGMPIVLHDGFDEQRVINDISRHNVTIMSVVTTTLTRIVKALGGKNMPAQFRCMLLGGGPAPLSLLDTCAEIGIPVFQSYGMTETSSQIVTLSPENSFNKIGSAGKPLFPAQLKIIDAGGVEVKPREEGEIIVKGPNVTTGYLYREKENAEKIQNGWLHTGDIGYVDEEGFLYVLDRRADLIISGGENIYPAQIEGALLSHQEVFDAGVIGIDDDKWGQVPIAFVVCDPASLITAEELLSFCRQKLASYKVPKRIIFTERLPRNASNKLVRRQLRDLLERGSGQ